MKRDWYTVQQAAKEFRRSVRTIRRWLAAGMDHKTVTVGRTEHILISHEVLFEARLQSNHDNPAKAFQRADQ